MTYEISCCRICGNRELSTVVDLGLLALTGFFPRSRGETVPRGPLKLVRCQGDPAKVCGLVQLAHSFEPRQLFAGHYGYRSGINRSMREHLAGIVRWVERLNPLNANDVVVDIGSNDGTLLHCFSGKGRLLAGVDPLGDKFAARYPPGARILSDFFSLDSVLRLLDGSSANIVTAIAMFYDLQTPGKFLTDVRQILAQNGLLVVEMSYWPKLMRLGAYDTICHEHLGYYGLRQMAWLARQTGFRIVDASINSVNGSSFVLALARDDSSRVGNGLSIDWLWQHEEPFLQQNNDHAFADSMLAHRDGLRLRIADLCRQGVSVAGYGASTKGNVILQYCGFTEKDIHYIAEINSDKWGCVCPGSGIPIIDEQQALSRHPGVFLVLPWHLKPEIRIKEALYLQKGGRFLFPFESGEPLS